MNPLLMTFLRVWFMTWALGGTLKLLIPRVVNPGSGDLTTGEVFVFAGCALYVGSWVWLLAHFMEVMR